MLELGILKTYDSETHTAGVQLVGSLTTYLDNIPVATNIAAEAMITGNYVLLAIPGGNPRDACVVASWPQGSSGGGGAPADISCRVTHSVDQPVETYATGGNTTMRFDTERWDTDEIHDCLENNERLTCKTAGKYIVCFAGQWDLSPAARYRFILYKNASTKQAVSEVVTADDGYPGLTVTAIVDLQVDDYVWIAAQQHSGSDQVVNKADQNTPEFSMIRIA
jgi:hypothetical protein